MTGQLILLGLVIVMAVGTAANVIIQRLDKAARDRQIMMDAIAQIEAHVTWQSGFIEMSDGQREGLRRAVDSQIASRKFD